MSKYGIPYTGSKSFIAKEILGVLPSGKRLVDLFGGGFAISHCCLLEFYPNKWQSVLYNDHNPLLKPLIEKAISGYYNYDRFKPEWISRERFFAEKENDGYIKWIWSFGNNGCDYLFSKRIEESKRQAHQLVVFGEQTDLTTGIELKSTNIRDRRLEYMAYVRKHGQRNDLPHLQQLERLQRIERIEHLQQLEYFNKVTHKLEITCMDYRNYEYQDGDVVYCDIPYELAQQKFYGGGFDHKEFKDWVRSRDYPVFVSSYIEAPIIWQKQKHVTMDGGGKIYRQECVYRFN